MFSDYAFQANVAALSTQTDLIKKCIYIKICGPKPSTGSGWPQWDWNNNLLYTINFDELPALTNEIVSIINNTAKEPSTKRAYSDNSKIIAFGKGGDGIFKIAIQNTTKDGGTQKTAFSFVNVEDLTRFMTLLQFLTQKPEQLFQAEFIINSVINMLKTELYKMNKPQQQQTNYNKPYQNKGQQAAPQSGMSNIADMFEGAAPTANTAAAVNNVITEFGGDIEDLL